MKEFIQDIRGVFLKRRLRRLDKRIAKNTLKRRKQNVKAVALVNKQENLIGAGHTDKPCAKL